MWLVYVCFPNHSTAPFTLIPQTWVHVACQEWPYTQTTVIVLLYMLAIGVKMY